MKVANLDYMYVNFLSWDDLSFNTFDVTLDNYFKSLLSDRSGSTSVHIEGISKDQENALWDSGVPMWSLHWDCCVQLFTKAETVFA